MSILGLLALIVAVVGVYAIAAHSAQQRTHELGVRLALGAPMSGIRRMVVWDTIRSFSWELQSVSQRQRPSRYC